MARLIVVAESEDTIAAPGNRKRNYILVSVTNASGVPRSKLTKKNFTVRTLIVGPGGSQVKLEKVTLVALGGFYRLDVVPAGKATWKAGVYIFGIIVSEKTGSGQTLVKVRLN